MQGTGNGFWWSWNHRFTYTQAGGLYPEIDDQHIMDGGSLFRGGARGSPAAGEVLSRAKG